MQSYPTGQNSTHLPFQVLNVYLRRVEYYADAGKYSNATALADELLQSVEPGSMKAFNVLLMYCEVLTRLAPNQMVQSIWVFSQLEETACGVLSQDHNLEAHTDARKKASACCIVLGKMYLALRMHAEALAMVHAATRVHKSSDIGTRAEIEWLRAQVFASISGLLGPMSMPPSTYPLLLYPFLREGHLISQKEVEIGDHGGYGLMGGYHDHGMMPGAPYTRLPGFLLFTTLRPLWDGKREAGASRAQRTGETVPEVAVSSETLADPSGSRAGRGVPYLDSSDVEETLWPSSFSIRTLVCKFYDVFQPYEGTRGPLPYPPNEEDAGSPGGEAPRHGLPMRMQFPPAATVLEMVDNPTRGPIARAMYLYPLEIQSEAQLRAYTLSAAVGAAGLLDSVGNLREKARANSLILDVLFSSYYAQPTLPRSQDFRVEFPRYDFCRSYDEAEYASSPSESSGGEAPAPRRIGVVGGGITGIPQRQLSSLATVVPVLARPGAKNGASPWGRGAFWYGLADVKNLVHASISFARTSGDVFQRMLALADLCDFRILSGNTGGDFSPCFSHLCEAFYACFMCGPMLLPLMLPVAYPMALQAYSVLLRIVRILLHLERPPEYYALFLDAFVHSETLLSNLMAAESWPPTPAEARREERDVIMDRTVESASRQFFKAVGNLPAGWVTRSAITNPLRGIDVSRLFQAGCQGVPMSPTAKSLSELCDGSVLRRSLYTSSAGSAFFSLAKRHAQLLLRDYDKVLTLRSFTPSPAGICGPLGTPESGSAFSSAVAEITGLDNEVEKKAVEEFLSFLENPDGAPPNTQSAPQSEAPSCPQIGSATGSASTTPTGVLSGTISATVGGPLPLETQKFTLQRSGHSEKDLLSGWKRGEAPAAKSSATISGSVADYYLQRLRALEEEQNPRFTPVPDSLRNQGAIEALRFCWPVLLLGDVDTLRIFLSATKQGGRQDQRFSRETPTQGNAALLPDLAEYISAALGNTALPLLEGLARALTDLPGREAKKAIDTDFTDVLDHVSHRFFASVLPRLQPLPSLHVLWSLKSCLNFPKNYGTILGTIGEPSTEAEMLFSFKPSPRAQSPSDASLFGVDTVRDSSSAEIRGFESFIFSLQQSSAVMRATFSHSASQEYRGELEAVSRRLYAPLFYEQPNSAKETVYAVLLQGTMYLTSADGKRRVKLPVVGFVSQGTESGHAHPSIRSNKSSAKSRASALHGSRTGAEGESLKLKSSPAMSMGLPPGLQDRLAAGSPPAKGVSGVPRASPSANSRSGSMFQSSADSWGSDTESDFRRLDTEEPGGIADAAGAAGVSDAAIADSDDPIRPLAASLQPSQLSRGRGASENSQASRGVGGSAPDSSGIPDFSGSETGLSRSSGESDDDPVGLSTERHRCASLLDRPTLYHYGTPCILSDVAGSTTGPSSTSPKPRRTRTFSPPASFPAPLLTHYLSFVLLGNSRDQVSGSSGHSVQYYSPLQDGFFLPPDDSWGGIWQLAKYARLGPTTPFSNASPGQEGQGEQIRVQSVFAPFFERQAKFMDCISDANSCLCLPLSLLGKDTLKPKSFGLPPDRYSAIAGHLMTSWKAMLSTLTSNLHMIERKSAAARSFLSCCFALPALVASPRLSAVPLDLLLNTPVSRELTLLARLTRKQDVALHRFLSYSASYLLSNCGNTLTYIKKNAKLTADLFSGDAGIARLKNLRLHGGFVSPAQPGDKKTRIGVKDTLKYSFVQQINLEPDFALMAADPLHDFVVMSFILPDECKYSLFRHDEARRQFWDYSRAASCLGLGQLLAQAGGPGSQRGISWQRWPHSSGQPTRRAHVQSSRATIESGCLVDHDITGLPAYSCNKEALRPYYSMVSRLDRVKPERGTSGTLRLLDVRKYCGETVVASLTALSTVFPTIDDMYWAPDRRGITKSQSTSGLQGTLSGFLSGGSTSLPVRVRQPLSQAQRVLGIVDRLVQNEALKAYCSAVDPMLRSSAAESRAEVGGDANSWTSQPAPQTDWEAAIKPLGGTTMVISERSLVVLPTNDLLEATDLILFMLTNTPHIPLLFVPGYYLSAFLGFLASARESLQREVPKYKDALAKRSPTPVQHAQHALLLDFPAMIRSMVLCAERCLGVSIAVFNLD